MDLVGRPEAEALARPHADGGVRRRDVPVADRPEVSPLREVLAHEAVGVLVGVPLPGAVGLGEEELDVAGGCGGMEGSLAALEDR